MALDYTKDGATFATAGKDAKVNNNLFFFKSIKAFRYRAKTIKNKINLMDDQEKINYSGETT